MKQNNQPSTPGDSLLEQITNITKGEWKIGGTTRGLNNYYIEANNQNIAQIFTSIPECEANAQLIASAPKLKKENEIAVSLLKVYEAENEKLTGRNKELLEALEEIKNMETSGTRFDVLRIAKTAINNNTK